MKNSPIILWYLFLLRERESSKSEKKLPLHWSHFNKQQDSLLKRERDYNYIIILHKTAAADLVNHCRSGCCADCKESCLLARCQVLFIVRRDKRQERTVWGHFTSWQHLAGWRTVSRDERREMVSVWWTVRARSISWESRTINGDISLVCVPPASRLGNTRPAPAV